MCKLSVQPDRDKLYKLLVDTCQTGVLTTTSITTVGSHLTIQSYIN